ncbi:MAG: glycine--tRNA ligase subunit beta [Alphaproteobacteria bacterium]
MSEFLLEIYGEEIPAGMQKKALLEAKTLMGNLFKNYNIKISAKTFITPLRLAVFINALPTTFLKKAVIKRGPRTDAPRKALEGFIKSTNNSFDNLFKNDQLFQKNNYWYLKDKNDETIHVTSIIPSIVLEFLKNMPWPKTMCWSIGECKTSPWVRPIRHILCLFDNKPIIFDIPDFAIKTGNITHGHKFKSPNPIVISNFVEYKEKLKEAFVIIDFEERVSIIKNDLKKKAIDISINVEKNEELFETMAGLVEYPFVGIGKIDPHYLTLPHFVLKIVMNVHQKYAAFYKSDNKIAPFFGFAANVPLSSLIQKGYENVLKARLDDALFFYECDKKLPLESLVPKLENVMFHPKLGNFRQKVDRIAEQMDDEKGKRAAFLCKADLLTQMVYEFPELQGLMGSEYARIQGEEKDVCDAVSFHYEPKTANDDVPESALARKLALFDKVDTLVGFISKGIYPTGTKDPFALRRTALSTIKLLFHNDFKELDFDVLLSNATQAYEIHENEKIANIIKPCFDFIKDRLSAFWEENHDITKAILKVWHERQPLWWFNQARNFLIFFSKNEQFQSFLQSQKRLYGLIKDVPKSKISKGLFKEDIEQKLYSEFKFIDENLYIKFLKTGEFDKASLHLYEFSKILNEYLDKITVFDKDSPDLSNNRYALLYEIYTLTDSLSHWPNLFHYIN